MKLYILGDLAPCTTEMVVWDDEQKGWVELVRAEGAERYARLGRAVMASRELGDARYYARKASQANRFASAGSLGAGPHLKDAAVYCELEAVLRAIEEADGEG